MADLVTHLCTALLPKAFLGGPHTGTFAVGVALPDLTSRVPGILLSRLHRWVVPIPDAVIHPFAVLHMPVGIAAFSVLAAWLFPPDQRRAALAWLLGGGALHLAVDLLQDHHGNGYYLGFPFTLADWELAWIGSEATVLAAPCLALITVAAWLVRWRRTT